MDPVGGSERRRSSRECNDNAALERDMMTDAIWEHQTAEVDAQGRQARSTRIQRDFTNSLSTSIGGCLFVQASILLAVSSHARTSFIIEIACFLSLTLRIVPPSLSLHLVHPSSLDRLSISPSSATTQLSPSFSKLTRSETRETPPKHLPQLITTPPRLLSTPPPLVGLISNHHDPQTPRRTTITITIAATTTTTIIRETWFLSRPKDGKFFMSQPAQEIFRTLRISPLPSTPLRIISHFSLSLFLSVPLSLSLFLAV